MMTCGHNDTAWYSESQHTTLAHCVECPKGDSHYATCRVENSTQVLACYLKFVHNFIEATLLLNLEMRMLKYFFLQICTSPYFGLQVKFYLLANELSQVNCLWE
jgi:hypothetical protein